MDPFGESTGGISPFISQNKLMVEEYVIYQEDCAMDFDVIVIFWMVMIGSFMEDILGLHRCYGVAFKREFILSKAMEVNGLFSEVQGLFVRFQTKASCNGQKIENCSVCVTKTIIQMKILSIIGSYKNVKQRNQGESTLWYYSTVTGPSTSTVIEPSTQAAVARTIDGSMLIQPKGDTLPTTKKKKNVALGHLIAYVLEKKYNLIHPETPNNLPIYFPDASFRALFHRDQGDEGDEMGGQEEAPAPAPAPRP
ncbi:hypothetical protein IEQ34_020855 [Dendrobium chrysotoxum]|uniref:Uncharacterized protein n=1 Tax=Dendrobium chrysotoxum TaxID=161865 RepID=A0AAV7G390_DENCH|nr:hypothetical protein IEQ34_020855 [Dendrobium chrysotoxum]